LSQDAEGGKVKQVVNMRLSDGIQLQLASFSSPYRVLLQLNWQMHGPDGLTLEIVPQYFEALWVFEEEFKDNDVVGIVGNKGLLVGLLQWILCQRFSVPSLVLLASFWQRVESVLADHVPQQVHTHGHVSIDGLCLVFVVLRQHVGGNLQIAPIFLTALPKAENLLSDFGS
jgi:hypothetical protein